MKWQKNNLPERFVQFAKNMFNVEGADAGIEALKTMVSENWNPGNFKRRQHSGRRHSNAG